MGPRSSREDSATRSLCFTSHRPLCGGRRLSVFFTLVLIAVFLYVFIAQQTTDEDSEKIVPARYSLDEMRTFAFRHSLSADYKPAYYTRRFASFSRILSDPKSRFNMTAKDVLVFLHIQKTAGTSFEKFLVRNLDIPQPCECTNKKKKCTCRREGTRKEVWLFSRYSTGWTCGLHADFTELFISGCVDTVLDRKEGFVGGSRSRRYFYTTFLRDPVTRFISEYRHVSRGATWIASRHVCNGRPPTPEELPLCFDPRIGWEGVTLTEFVGCPYNLAFNRQTRMLADLTLVNCYAKDTINSISRDNILLESAKANLRNFAFFGIKERMKESQEMFETIFRLRFTKSLDDWTKSKSNDTKISPEMLQKIKEVNALDIQLYEYAWRLFDERMKLIRSQGAPAGKKVNQDPIALPPGRREELVMLPFRSRKKENNRIGLERMDEAYIHSEEEDEDPKNEDTYL